MAVGCPNLGHQNQTALSNESTETYRCFIFVFGKPPEHGAVGWTGTNPPEPKARGPRTELDPVTRHFKASSDAGYMGCQFAVLFASYKVNTIESFC
jgi:hypothetical protein